MNSVESFLAACRFHAVKSGIIFGSGLGVVAETWDLVSALPYDQIPGFASSTIVGHRGELRLSIINELPVLCGLGRIHFYERHPWSIVTGLVEFLHLGGIQSLILTNASGGIDHTLQPGDLLAIQAHRELIAPHQWKTWYEQPPHADAYDFAARQLYQDVCRELGEPFHTGTYGCVTGPCYETPAEIRAFSRMGVSVVGMSTSQEALRAAQLGIRVLALSCVTNAAAGIGNEPLLHSDVQAKANEIRPRMQRLLPILLQRLSNSSTD